MSTLKVNTILNAAGTGTPAIDGLAKAWVNFNGTGTVAIRAAFNVSSITDNGTGDYTVNFTTSMIDSNYCVSSAVSDTVVTLRIILSVISTSATNFNIETGRTDSQALVDQSIVCCSVFR